MRLRALVMIRDEIDIIELFLRHCDALFDEVYLLDHLSIDGTQEILKEVVRERPGWKYYRITFKQWMQKTIYDAFYRKFADDEFDYLFPLDADEFIWVKDREELENKLKPYAGSPQVLAHEWINAIPTKTQCQRVLSARSTLRVSKSIAKFTKVVIPSCLIREREVRNVTGNHVVYSAAGELYPLLKIGKMLHIPLRSRDQIICKSIVTEIGRQLDLEQTIYESVQYRMFLNSYLQNGLNPEEIINSLFVYQDAGAQRPSDWYKEFVQSGSYKSTIEKMNLAVSGRMKLRSGRIKVNLATQVANALVSNHPIKPSEAKIRITEDTIDLEE